MDSPTVKFDKVVDLSKIADREKEAAEQRAKDSLMVAQAIAVLGRVVPSWPRRQRRALANALRLGGRGYTKP